MHDAGDVQKGGLQGCTYTTFQSKCKFPPPQKRANVNVSAPSQKRAMQLLKYWLYCTYKFGLFFFILISVLCEWKLEINNEFLRYVAQDLSEYWCNCSCTDLDWSFQTSFTTPCNGLVSHAAPTGGILVLADYTRRSKHNQNAPMSCMPWRHFMRVHLHAQPACAVDAGGMHPRNLEGGIESLFYSCVIAMRRRPYWLSRMEVSYCTFGFGANIRCDLRTLSLPRDSLCNNPYACVI